MNMSYKIALVFAVAICALVIGYYVLDDEAPTGGGLEAPPTGGREVVSSEPATSQAGDDEDAATAPAPEPVAVAVAVAVAEGEGEGEGELTDTSRGGALERADATPTSPAEALHGRADHGRADGRTDGRATPSVEARVREEIDTTPSLTIGLPRPSEEDDSPTGAPPSSQATDASTTSHASHANDVTTPEPPAMAKSSADDPGADRNTDTDARAEADTPQTYTIQQGDTFSSLAERFYGNERHWRHIVRANPGVNPDRLRVGQQIYLPNVDDVHADRVEPPETQASTSAGPPAGTTHIVRRHDTLSRIAEQYYNDAGKWSVIYEANRERIGDDPGRIDEGMELTIPPAD